MNGIVKSKNMFKTFSFDCEHYKYDSVNSRRFDSYEQ